MNTLLKGIKLFVLLSLLAGLIYPMALTGLLQVLYPVQAYGSLIHQGPYIRGSALLAQKFTDSKYFWPRPSSTDYATIPSGASHLGPTSTALKTALQDRLSKLRLTHTISAEKSVPADLIFASASGLDPHISPEAALFQVHRVAQARHFTAEQEQRCQKLVQQSVESPQFGFLGQARVNVLLLNLELDALK
jgi:potassium-transporting ATPase KdpC subunit